MYDDLLTEDADGYSEQQRRDFEALTDMPEREWPPTDERELAALDRYMDQREKEWAIENGFDPLGNLSLEEWLRSGLVR